MELSQRLDFSAFEAKEEAATLESLVAEVCGIEVTPETRLDNGAVASLDRIELAVRIEEQFGVRIDERVYEEHPTIGELADYVAQA